MQGKLLACILADDLTGAADTGIQFSRQGVPTEVVLSVERLGTASVQPGSAVAVDLGTRPLTAGDAYRRVRAAVDAVRPCEPELFYKKVDSGLRGNLAAELRAMLDAVPGSLLVLAPAFPENARTTVDGVQCVDGVPVTKHEVGQDALTPVSTAHIPTLLQAREFAGGGAGEGDEKDPVGIPGELIESLSLDRVRAGAAVVSAALMSAHAKGKRLVVVDAVERRDLALLADGLVDLPFPKVLAGSAGLARELPHAFGWARPRHTLIVSLSMKEMARTQLSKLEAFARHACRARPAGSGPPACSGQEVGFRRINIAAERLVCSGSGPTGTDVDVRRNAQKASQENFQEVDREVVRQVAREVVREVVQGLAVGHVALSVAEDAPLIESAALNAALEAIIAEAVTSTPAKELTHADSSAALNIPPAGSTGESTVGSTATPTEKSAGTLRRSLRRTFRRSTVQGACMQIGALIVVGGDTVRSVCAGARCTRLHLEHRELEPGVPLCTMADGALVGTPLVMKSGSFGDSRTLERLFRAVSGLEARALS